MHIDWYSKDYGQFGMGMEGVIHDPGDRLKLNVWYVISVFEAAPGWVWEFFSPSQCLKWKSGQRYDTLPLAMLAAERHFNPDRSKLIDLSTVDHRGDTTDGEE